MQQSVDTSVKINASGEIGDILIFLTGQEEVDRAVRLLREHANELELANKKNKMLILPMYGSLPYHEQLKVFKHAPDGCRKVVVATNVAETSITIPGIVHGKYILIGNYYFTSSSIVFIYLTIKLMDRVLLILPRQYSLSVGTFGVYTKLTKPIFFTFSMLTEANVQVSIYIMMIVTNLN